jgi:hypothetical protein
MTDFPTILYKTPGPHKKPRGGTYKTTGASDKEEFDALLKQGWFPSYEEAVAGKVASKPVDEAADDAKPYSREELEEQAKELGVSFNARTSDKKLAERIIEALEG